MRFNPGEITKAAIALVMINNQEGVNCFQDRPALTQPLKITAIQANAHDIIAPFPNKSRNLFQIGHQLRIMG